MNTDSDLLAFRRVGHRGPGDGPVLHTGRGRSGGRSFQGDPDGIRILFQGSVSI